MKTITDGISIAARISYLDGQIKGITDYAIWRNGEQLVGCLERPLREVIYPLKFERALLVEKIGEEELNRVQTAQKVSGMGDMVLP